MVFAWACIGFLLPASFTVTYWKDLPVWMCSFILAGGRVTLGIVTGVAIILCHLGHGGWFNAIFAHRVFQHTQKLTYTAYLLNPLVIFSLAGSKEKGIQVDFLEQVTLENFLQNIVIYFYFDFVLISGNVFHCCFYNYLPFGNS